MFDLSDFIQVFSLYAVIRYQAGKQDLIVTNINLPTRIGFHRAVFDLDRKYELLIYTFTNEEFGGEGL